MKSRSALRDLQREHIFRIVGAGGPTCWKVLVLDPHTRTIVSPIVHVQELKERNVTLHLDLNANRLHIPETPAIYFIEPTASNIGRIGKDFEARCYGEYYFYFCSYIGRDLLEELAKLAVKYSASSRIRRVSDEYMDFVCLEDNLFSFEHENSFEKLNQMPGPEYFHKLSTQLTCLAMLLDNGIPLLRYKGSSSGSKLIDCIEQKLRDHIKPRTKLSPSRPDLYLIVDRKIDLVSPLEHKWTYGGLIHDCLEAKLNRVKCIVEENGQQVPKVFDIDVGDSFWKQNHHLSFQQAAENVDLELQQYKTDMDKVSGEMGELGSSSLQSTMFVVPKLTERKRIIDHHMNMALAVLGEIQERKLDSLFEFERSVRKHSKREFIELFDSVVHKLDKLRLLIIYRLRGADQLDDGDLERCFHHLDQDQARNIFEAVDRFCLEKDSPIETQSIHIASPVSPSSYFDKIKGGMLSNLARGMKHLLPSSVNSGLLDHVDMLMSAAHQESTFFIPEGTMGIVQRDPGQTMARGYGRVVVFVVGGISYDEHQLLKDHFSKQGMPTCIIGATEILSAASLIDQLGRLGQHVDRNFLL